MPWGGTYSVELRRRLAPSVTLHLAELSPHNLSFIEERFRQEQLSLDHVVLDVFTDGLLPYPDASLDAVILTQTLEHMPTPEAMLDEVARVLKQGGQLILSVRNLDSAYGRHWGVVESRAQIPNQGPFQPLKAGRVQGWLAARFHLDAEIGIGMQATHDAVTVEGDGCLDCRLYAARCIRD